MPVSAPKSKFISDKVGGGRGRGAMWSRWSSSLGGRGGMSDGSPRGGTSYTCR